MPDPLPAAPLRPLLHPAEAARTVRARPRARAARQDAVAIPRPCIARPGFEKQLAQRTLTSLYNQRPAWLAQAHTALDAAVATAYGWTDWHADLPDDELLRRLLALNRERATRSTPLPRPGAGLAAE